MGEIAAMGNAAGRSLDTNRTCPCDGLDVIVACLAVWRLRLAGVDPGAVWARGARNIDKLVAAAVEFHKARPSSAGDCAAVIV